MTRHARQSAVSLALLASALVGLQVAAGGGGILAFDAVQVAVDEAGEPSLLVGPTSMIVAVPYAGGSHSWISTDSGASFSPALTTQSGGGDTDIAMDGSGRLYIVDLFGDHGEAMPVFVSEDGGRTIAYSSAALPRYDSFWDRQWIAANDEGGLVIIATNKNVGLASWSSRDHARTWVGPVQIDAAVRTLGAVESTADGGFAFAYCGSDHLYVATSADVGLTWTSHPVTDARCEDFPILAVDDVGGLHVAWTGSARVSNTDVPAILYANSNDAGVSWIDPVVVSPIDSLVLFPWIKAGAPGRVAITYYQSEPLPVIPRVGAAPADALPPTIRWDVMVATSLDAGSASPTFARQVVYEGFHHGPICTLGSSCFPAHSLGYLNAPVPGDRRLLDFFEMDIDAEGRIYIAHPVDRAPHVPDSSEIRVKPASLRDEPTGLWEATVDLVLSRQVDGPRLR